MSRDRINVSEFAVTQTQRDAVGDGASKPMSTYYANLAAAQADYPHVGALTDQLDWVVIQGAINSLSTTDNQRGQIYIPRGTYIINKTVTRPRWVSVSGDGPMATELKASGTAFGPLFDFSGTGNEFDIVDSMYYINGNSILSDAIDLNAKDTISLENFRINAHSGIGVHIGSYNCRVQKALIAGGTTGVKMDSDASASAGANGCVLDQIWVQSADTGVHITGDNTASSGILLTGCLFDQNDTALLIDGATNPPGDVSVIGCRFEDNSVRSIKTNSLETYDLIVLGSFFSGAIAYHIEITSKDARIAFNHFAGYSTAAIKLAFDARRTFVGFNSAHSFSLPLIEDANTSRLLSQLDTFDTGLASMKRYSAHEANAHTSSNFALSAGWGTGASVGSITANDSRGRFVVTAGTGSFSANPTITITFAQGAWPGTPFLRLQRNGGAQVTAPLEYSVTTTTATITFKGTPAAGETYTIEFFAMS